MAALAAVVTLGLLGQPLPDIEPASGAFLFELLGAFLLVFVITQVTVREVPLSPLAIGMALTVGALIASSRSGGVLNPALGLAMILSGVVNGLLLSVVPYLVAPLLAGAAAGVLGSWLGTGRAPQRAPRGIPEAAPEG